MLRAVTSVLMLVGLIGCDTIYQSPSVNPVRDGEAKVRVVPMTAETVIAANRSTYEPQGLPAVFFSSPPVVGTTISGGTVPRPLEDPGQAGFLETRAPPPLTNGPYQIGIGDVLLLATPQVGSTVEQLTGLLAASNARQGYTVQDDGAIAIPNVGRVQVAGMTLEEAESELFQRLVENQIDPTFSLEVAEFNSRKVSIGGAVSNPIVVNIGLNPLFLDEALAAAGGVSTPDVDTASVRIYRDGTLYQIPLNELYSNRGLQRTQLTDGDSLFIDTEFELERAQAYFEQEIRTAEFRQRTRLNQITLLRAEFENRREAMQDVRRNFIARIELDAVDRDYVYLTGEFTTQNRYPLPFDRRANLADAIYSNGGIPTRTGSVREIYVLRGSDDPREFGAITAWQLDGRDATNFLMATRFELRPNDVIFVAEQPVTRWGRVIEQITPSLITTGVAVAAN